MDALATSTFYSFPGFLKNLFLTHLLLHYLVALNVSKCDGERSDKFLSNNGILDLKMGKWMVIITS